MSKKGEEMYPVKVALDCDGVLACLDETTLQIVKQREYDMDWVGFEKALNGRLQRLQDTPEGEELREMLDLFLREFSKQGHVVSLPIMPGAHDTLSWLQENQIRAKVVTAPWAKSIYWIPERIEWLVMRGFKPQDVVFSHEKTEVVAEVFVDDSLEHIINNRSRFRVLFATRRALYEEGIKRFRGNTNVAVVSSHVELVEVLDRVLGEDSRESLDRLPF